MQNFDSFFLDFGKFQMSLYESLLHTDHQQVRLRICHFRRVYVLQLMCNQCTIQMKSRSKRNGSSKTTGAMKYVQLTLKTLQYHARLWSCLSYIYNNPLRYESIITVRELYYNLSDFDSSNQVSEILKDLCQILSVQRHQLCIEASPKGQVLGDLIVVQPDGVCIDCSSQPQLISSGMVQEDIEMYSSARMIIVVEKEAIFSRLVAQQLHRRLQAVLVTGKGVPCSLTKRFVKEIQTKLLLPAYGLFDYNPFGASIFLNYRIGAQSGTWDASLYNANIQYIGLFWSDLVRLQLSDSYLKPLTARDISVARGLLQIPFVAQQPEYFQVVADMIESNVKADLESLNEVEFDFVATFLQSKLLTAHSSGRWSHFE